MQETEENTHTPTHKRRAHKKQTKATATKTHPFNVCTSTILHSYGVYYCIVYNFTSILPLFIHTSEPLQQRVYQRIFYGHRQTSTSSS